MKTWKILVKGRVQKVGYRRIVDEIAYNLGINGHVRNLDDKKTVEVIAQHKDENIMKKFVELIKVNEYPIKVESVELHEIKEKEFTSFEVIEGSLEIENRESLEAGTIYLRRLAGEMKSMNGEMKSMNVSLNNKMDKISDTLIETNVAITQGFAGTHKRLEKIDQTMSEQMADLRQRVAKIEQVLHIKN